MKITPEHRIEQTMTFEIHDKVSTQALFKLFFEILDKICVTPIPSEVKSKLIINRE